MTLIKEISDAKGAYIIAEAGVNFADIAAKEGISPMDAAKRMIEAAKQAGADAIKFQTYKAGKLASKNSPAYWDLNEEPTTSQFELFSKFDAFGEKEYRALAAHCQDVGISFWSTPFDFDAADFLNPLMPAYKISSSDLTNLPFIAHIAKKGKPVFLSTGAATIGEIEQALNTALATGNSEICLMHCVLDYPTADENANLKMLKHLEQIFPGYLLGYSDHTRPDESMVICTTAYLLGAKVIEKHFTLDKTLKGNDHYHAMAPDDLEKLIRNIRTVDAALGQYRKAPLPCETASRKQARRSIVAARTIAAGEIIAPQDVTFKRPGTGISPADLDKIIGRAARRTIQEDALIAWADV